MNKESLQNRNGVVKTLREWEESLVETEPEEKQEEEIEEPKARRKRR